MIDERQILKFIEIYIEHNNRAIDVAKKTQRDTSYLIGEGHGLQLLRDYITNVLLDKPEAEQDNKEDQSNGYVEPVSVVQAN